MSAHDQHPCPHCGTPQYNGGVRQCTQCGELSCGENSCGADGCPSCGGNAFTPSTWDEIMGEWAHQ